MAAETLRTLLVEDDATDARRIRALLEGQVPAIALEEVTRVADAITRVQEGRIDVVLLDLAVTDGQGMDGIRRLHDAAWHVPIVVLTAVEDDDDALRAVHEGAQDALAKGRFSASLLSRALRHAHERKRAEENGRRLLLERARRVQAEAAERRATFLAEAGSRLASVLDYDEMPHHVAQLSVPILADCCLIDVLDESGEIVRVACACAEESKTALARKLLGFTKDVALEQHPVQRALRSGYPALVSEVTPEFVDAISGEPEHGDTLRKIGARSMLTVPLVARGRTLGAITFVSAESGHVYGPEDLAFAWALADRAALAMDNAKLFRAREEMLSVVSHDLRNPLNVITVGLASLRRGVQDERRTQFLEKIRRAADRMNRLIDDLLDVTRLETGSLPVEREAYAVAPIVGDAFEMLRPLAEEKSIRLVSEVPEGLPPIFADRDRVLQILGNLVGNALKFTPRGGTVTIAARAERGAVQLSVIDTGPGIRKEEQSRIFDRYYQVKRTDRKGGSGLGLAIAKGLALAHGGNISVESEPGAGATFRLSLPVAADGVPLARTSFAPSTLTSAPPPSPPLAGGTSAPSAPSPAPSAPAIAEPPVGEE